MHRQFKKVIVHDSWFLTKCIFIGFVILVCLLFILSRYSKSNGRVFYISSSGDDAYSGTSPGSAWSSLEKVNSFEFKPGDTVCFKKGDVWRGQLLPRSGTEKASVTYKGYGKSAQRPLILGSISKNLVSDWTMRAENVWCTDGDILDIGNIIFNGNTCAVKVWSDQELTEQNRFYYNLKTKELFLFSEKNPAILYKSIECAQSRFIIDETNSNYVVYDGLSLKYGGSHGIGGTNTGNITVRNCDISFMGGGDLYKDGTRRTRYGNGIEFWGNAHDILVENCSISEIYDAALTNQNAGQTALQKNITYRKNKIWNSEYSFEYWNSPGESRTENILFEENACTDAGSGWSHAQRPDKSGRHLCFYAGSAPVTNFSVRGNNFKNAAECLVYVNLGFASADAVDFSENEYSQQNNKIYAIWGLNKLEGKEFMDFISSRRVR
jgi:hypothetical protein